MKKFEIVKYETLTRMLTTVVEAEDWEDARNQFYSMDDMGEGYEKLLDSDWEINEVRDD